jgi:hypothetical protein
MKIEDVPQVHVLPWQGRVVAKVRGRTTKFVCCEACGQNYAYELKRTGAGSEPVPDWGWGRDSETETAAKVGAVANLRNRLRTGIEVIPCPACGWYQAHMLPKARRLHPRWMVYVGGCLTFGLIPVTLIGLTINGMNVSHGGEPFIPWPIFFAGMASLFIVGIGMLIGKYILARSYDPNDADVETRKRYGQSRALLLSEQEAQDMEARLLSEQEETDMEELLWRANASNPIDWSVRRGCPTLPRSDVSGAGPHLSSWLPGLALRSAALLLLLLLLFLLFLLPPGPD